jgi:hypothetical protein
MTTKTKMFFNLKLSELFINLEYATIKINTKSVNTEAICSRYNSLEGNITLTLLDLLNRNKIKITDIEKIFNELSTSGFELELFLPNNVESKTITVIFNLKEYLLELRKQSKIAPTVVNIIMETNSSFQVTEFSTHTGIALLKNDNYNKVFNEYYKKTKKLKEKLQLELTKNNLFKKDKINEIKNNNITDATIKEVIQNTHHLTVIDDSVIDTLSDLFFSALDLPSTSSLLYKLIDNKENYVNNYDIYVKECLNILKSLEVDNKSMTQIDSPIL